MFAVLAAALLSHQFIDRPLSGRRTNFALYLCLATQIALGLNLPPVSYVVIENVESTQRAFFAVVGLLTFSILRNRPLLRSATFPVIVLLFVAMGIWVIQK